MMTRGDGQQRGRMPGGRIALLPALALLVALGEPAGAGEAGRRRRGRDAGEEGATAESKPLTLSEMNLEQLREYQAFSYTAGKRDPFTFRKAEEAPAEDTTARAGAGQLPGDVEELSEGDKNQYLLEEKTRIEFLLLAHEYDAVLKRAEEVRRTVEEEWRGVPASGGMLWREILTMQKTAKRLAQNRESRREFEGLNIVITGIRWTPRGASALINGRIYEAGETLEEVGAGRARIRIEAIEEDAVIFVYKGLRFRKGVGVAPQTGIR